MRVIMLLISTKGWPSHGDPTTLNLTKEHEWRKSG